MPLIKELVMLWYAFQITVILSVIHVYVFDIKPTNATFGHIVVFAILVSYCLTWLLSKIYDLLLTFKRWANGVAHKRPDCRPRINSSATARQERLIPKIGLRKRVKIGPPRNRIAGK